MGEPPRIALAATCRKNGLVLTEDQLGRLEQYARLLTDWNDRVNLVSRRDTENLWSAHLLHSISLLFKLELPPSAQVMDLGSGGGLPGIPLAIVRPDLRMVLVDSIAKKTAALASMIAVLQLENVAVVTGRVEELGGDHAGRYGVVIARAVAPLQDLLKWSAKVYDRTVPGGAMLITYKGGDLEPELARARTRSGMHDIHVIPLVFQGSAEAGLEDKKLIVVHLH